MRPAHIVAFLLSAALALIAGPAAGQSRPPDGASFGGRPTSPKAGHIVASGRVVLSPIYADPKVEVLIGTDSPDPTGITWYVHPAKRTDGKWTIDIPEVKPGTYRVRLRCHVTLLEDGRRGEIHFPEDPEKTPYPYVVVK